jgi:hypothetical protein
MVSIVQSNDTDGYIELKNKTIRCGYKKLNLKYFWESDILMKKTKIRSSPLFQYKDQFKINQIPWCNIWNFEIATANYYKKKVKILGEGDFTYDIFDTF